MSTRAQKKSNQKHTLPSLPQSLVATPQNFPNVNNHRSPLFSPSYSPSLSSIFSPQNPPSVPDSSDLTPLSLPMFASPPSSRQKLLRLDPISLESGDESNSNTIPQGSLISGLILPLQSQSQQSQQSQQLQQQQMVSPSPVSSPSSSISNLSTPFQTSSSNTNIYPIIKSNTLIEKLPRNLLSVMRSYQIDGVQFLLNNIFPKPNEKQSLAHSTRSHSKKINEKNSSLTSPSTSPLFTSTSHNSHSHSSDPLSDVHGCILADDMGLGKALQVIAFLLCTCLNQNEPNVPISINTTNQIIILCSTTALVNWEFEFEKWWYPNIPKSSEGSNPQFIVNVFDPEKYSKNTEKYEFFKKHLDSKHCSIILMTYEAYSSLSSESSEQIFQNKK